MLDLGFSLTSIDILRAGQSGPSLRLSPRSIEEDAGIGDPVGTLSVVNGSGSYTFSITADPNSKFAIDGDALELGDTLDYETATSHSVTIEANNGVDPIISRTFTITVTDVFESANSSFFGDRYFGGRYFGNGYFR